MLIVLRLLARIGPVPATIALALFACDRDTGVPATSLVPPGAQCAAPPRRTAAVALTAALGDRAFIAPVEMIAAPGDRFAVLEQKGRVLVVDRSGVSATVALDISANVVSGGEAGLLGIAFDPSFASNGFAYLSYTAPVAPPRAGVVFQSVIARFHSSDGGATLEPASERRLLVVDQPYSNHNGGHLAFGPENLLYISLGDGGSGGDPHGNGQNTDALLGKILRIDPHSAEPYGIPPSNPFANGGGRREIFAYGLRNPWKFTFDKTTGEMWAGDVGQGKYEEIDRVVLGGNYGWNTREGKHCYESESCSSDGLIDPVVDYGRDQGGSVTGGYVYRGRKLPELVGKLVYGDFSSGRIWAIERRGTESVGVPLLETNLNISSFGQDADGELYVVDYATGKVATFVAAEAPPAAGANTKLSDTGCVDVKGASTPPHMLAYDVNSPLWSDGASKDRSLFVPTGAKIHVLADGDFDVPPGSVAVKTFSVGGKKVETRLFARYLDATWAGFSYEWNDEQTDAALLAGAKTKPLANGQSWYFPSGAECFACHTQVAGFTLGLELRQLDRNEGGSNQLRRFASWLDQDVTPGRFAPLAAVDAGDAMVTDRARAYLHANCSICHRKGSGAGAATLDLHIERPLRDMRVCDEVPHAGDLRVPGLKLVTPRDPTKSAVALRMRALGEGRMPPLASRIVDESGASAVEAWIRTLPSACP